MSAESGYSNQKKLGTAQFKTIQGLGSDKWGAAVAVRSLYKVNVADIAITAVSLSPLEKKLTLTIPAHNARVNDVIKLQNGSLIAWEYNVEEVVDADNVKVWNTALPTVGTNTNTFRWITNLVDSTGSGGGGASTAPTYVALNKSLTDVSAVTSLAYTQILASVGATDVKKIQVFMSNGDPMYLAFGAAASEVDKIYITPGGNGYIDLNIPAGTRVSIKRVAVSTDPAGTLIINYLG